MSNQPTGFYASTLDGGLSVGEYGDKLSFSANSIISGDVVDIDLNLSQVETLFEYLEVYLKEKNPAYIHWFMNKE